MIPLKNQGCQEKERRLELGTSLAKKTQQISKLRRFQAEWSLNSNAKSRGRSEKKKKSAEGQTAQGERGK